MAAERKPKPSDGKPPKSFEENLSEIEGIVTDLEKGELPLEESIQKYQIGIERLKECDRILKDAQKKVDLLTRDAKGALTVKPLEFEDSGQEEG